MKLSTSLARQILLVLRNQFQNGGGAALGVYTGPVPVDADAPLPPGALIGYFSNGGNPIELTVPTNNTTGIAVGGVWTCQPLAAGTATFFRFLLRYDDQGGQISFDTAPVPRLQGTIGTSGADLIMADPVFAPGTAKEIRNFLLTLPLAT